MGKNGDEKAILDYDFNMIAGKVLKEKRIARGLSLDGLSDKIQNLVSKLYNVLRILKCFKKRVKLRII